MTHTTHTESGRRDVVIVGGGPAAHRLADSLHARDDGRTLRVRGRGVPKRDGAAGDLLVTVKVAIPQKLDDDATEALRRYAEAEKTSGFDPRAGWAGA